MAAPTFVAAYPVTSFTTLGASKSVTVTVNDRDTLVVVGICPDQAVTMGTPSGGSLTYTLQQEVNVSSYTRVAMWTATATSSTSFSVSITRGGSDFMWGFTVLVFRGSAGIGTVPASTNVASGAPSLAITTQAGNSALVVANGDWVPVNGASRTWRTPSGTTAISEQTYAFDASNYTAYIGYHSDAGVAGSKTVGLSAPTGQKYSIVALEVLGSPNGQQRIVPQAICRASLR